MPFPLRTIKAISYSSLVDTDANYLAIKQISETKSASNVINTINDPALGAITVGEKCHTCFQVVGRCQGHYGIFSFELGYYDKKLNETCIIKICKALCYECKSIRSDEVIKIEHLVNRLCAVCRSPKISKVDLSFGLMKLYRFSPPILYKVLFTKDLKDILDQLDDKSKQTLDPICRNPSRWFYQTIIVPPRTLRPQYVISSSGSPVVGSIAMNQILQSMLSEINKYSNQLRLCDGIMYEDLRPISLRDELARLATKIDHYYSMIVYGRSDTKIEYDQRSSQVSKSNSLLQSLRDKKGQLRGKVAGWIMDFIARMVISCDNTLRLDEISLPEFICRRLYKEEVVRPYNIKFLANLCKNKEYPHVHSIKTFDQDGRARLVTKTDDPRIHILRDGDIVRRNLIQGDYALINRQPTLDKDSIGAHRIRADPNSNVMSISISVTPHYRADFDGDQMNAIPATTSDLTVEFKQLANVRDNAIISSTRGYCILRFLQNELDGAYHLTEGKFVDDVTPYIPFIPNLPSCPGQLTGKQLIERILNVPEFSYSNKEIVIKNGVIQSGKLTKISLDHSPRSLFHKLFFHINDPEIFIQKYHQLGCACRAISYFALTTICIKDMFFDTNLHETILDKLSQIMKKSIKYSCELMTSHGKSNMVPLGTDLKTFHESQQIGILSVPENLITSVYDNISDNFRVLIESGQGDGMMTIKQTYVAIGQILQDDKRSNENGFSYRRSSQYSFRFDLNPICRGFTNENYLFGLSPITFIQNIQKSRTQIIDRQEGTTKSGYLSRRLSLACEPAITGILSEVRFNNFILQPLYGGDGLSVSIFHKTLDMNISTDTKKYNHSEQLLNEIREFQTKFKQHSNFGKDVPDESIYLFLPFDIYVVWNKSIMGVKPLSNPRRVDLDLLIRRVQMAYSQCVLDYIVKALTGLKYYLALFLTKERLRYWNKKVENNFTMEIYQAYSRGLIRRRHVVGLEAAVACSDPLTQAMLSSHKKEGGSGEKVSIFEDALIRSKQIIHQGNMYIYVNNGFDADAFVKLLPVILFRDLNPVYEIITSSDEGDDKEWLEFHAPNENETDIVLRIVLDTELMLSNEIDEMSLIVALAPLCEKYKLIPLASFGFKQFVIWIVVTVESPLLHNDFFTFFAKIFIRQCDEVIIKGVEGIKNAKVIKTGNQPLIITSGSNIRGLLSKYPNEVDRTRLMSTDKFEMEEVFGIFVTSKTIQSIIVNLSDYPDLPRRKHAKVICSIITLLGNVTPLTKTGIEKREPTAIEHHICTSNPIATLSKAQKYNIRSENRNLSGLSMTGSISSYLNSGTMAWDVSIKEDMIKQKPKNKKFDSIFD